MKPHDESLSERPTASPPGGAEPSPSDTHPGVSDGSFDFRQMSLSDVPTKAPPPETGKASLPPLQNRATRPGDALPARYEIRQPLGRGGMGEVFLAWDTQLNRQVVLKRIRPDLAKNPGMVERLFAEAQAAAALNHRHIVTVHDRGRDADGEFLVMEYVEGRSLLEEVQQNGALSIERAVKYVRQVGSALQAAHDAGIVHRDVKPSNILLNGQDEAKLADFGLARVLADTGHTQAGAALGTLDYAAPEQLRDAASAGPAADQFSLAATLYQLLTGRSPRMIRADWLPEHVRDTVLKALSDSPGDRFKRIDEFLAVLPGADVSVATSAAVDLAETLTRKKAHYDEMLATARSLVEKQHAYGQAVALLRQIPEHIRDEALLKLAIERDERSKQLDQEIRRQVDRYETRGLRGRIRELLKLQPSRTDLQKLLSTLHPVGSGSPELLSAPFGPEEIQDAVEQWCNYLNCPRETTTSIGLKLVFVPPGEFDMGDAPVHRVRITKPLYVSTTPVTQRQFELVMGRNPSHFRGNPNHPVERVSWHDAVEFCNTFSRKEGRAIRYSVQQTGVWIFRSRTTELTASGNGFRLPTEAEWEYSCRAGTTSPYWFGSELNGTEANCDGNYPFGTDTKGPYLRRTSLVGSYAANGFGLFDVHGNVWEWCQDWYESNYYAQSPTDDPVGPSSGSSRVCRGGSWGNNAAVCRSARRGSDDPMSRGSSIGFRVLSELRG